MIVVTTRSYATTAGTRLTFRLDDAGVVWVTTRTRALGGWNLDKFGDSLTIGWARAWADEVYAGRVQVTA